MQGQMVHDRAEGMAAQLRDSGIIRAGQSRTGKGWAVQDRTEQEKAKTAQKAMQGTVHCRIKQRA